MVGSLYFITYLIAVFAICSYLLVETFFTNSTLLKRLSALLVVGLLIRGIYFIRTSFDIEPLYDGYKYIITSALLYKYNRIPSVFLNIFDIRYCLSYPLLSMFTVIIGKLLGIHHNIVSFVRLCIFISLIQSFLMVLVAYLFGKTLARLMKFHEVYAILFLLLFVISPDAIYYGMIYYMRYYCATLIYILLFLILRFFEEKTAITDKNMLKLLIVFLLIIPFSYSAFPWVLLAFLLVILLLSIMIMFLLGVFKRKDFINHWGRILKILLGLCLLYIPAFVLGQIYYAFLGIAEINTKVVWNIISNYLSYFHERVLFEMKTLSSPYYIPPVLTTPWNVLTRVRDILIYIPAIIGFILYHLDMLKKSQKDKVWFSELTFSLITMTIVILYIASRAMFQVFLTPFIFIVLAYSAYSYYLLIARKRRQLKIVAILLLLVASLIAFLSPWSHRVILKHYYDLSISLPEAGDHNPHYPFISEFIHKYLNTSYIKSIYSDDIVLTQLILYDKINVVSIHGIFSIMKNYSFKQGHALIIILNGKYLLMKPYGWNIMNLALLQSEKALLIRRLELKGNMILRLNNYIFVIILISKIHT